MRGRTAIAAALAAALALPGCGGAARRPGAHAGAAVAPTVPRPAASTPERERDPGRVPGRARGRLPSAAPGSLRPQARRGTAPGRPAVLPSPLLRAFPILRRPAKSGDRPAGQARALLRADGRESAAHGEAPLLAAAARRLPASPAAWIVPARDRICLVRREPLSGADAPEAIECVSARGAMRGYLMSSFTGLPGAPGRSFLEGVLPAGARDVRLELAGGRRLPLALHQGAYSVVERGARALGFVRAGRRFSVPVPQPVGERAPDAGPATATGAAP